MINLVFYLLFLPIFNLLAMCREERDAWLDGLRHIMNPNNFQSPLLTMRYGGERGRERERGREEREGGKEGGREIEREREKE